MCHLYNEIHTFPVGSLHWQHYPLSHRHTLGSVKSHIIRMRVYVCLWEGGFVPTDIENKHRFPIFTLSLYVCIYVCMLWM